jgi:polyphosphate kinase
MTNDVSSPRYFNREVAWLEFNQLVLEEARDAAVPLLERLRFLAITASNLDEFFMVRVGGLQILTEEGVTSRDPAGLQPGEQLRAIRERTRRMMDEQYACYREEIEPGLVQAGIRRLQPEALSELQARAVERLVREEIQAIITPMAVGEETQFPLLGNQTLDLCVRLAPAPRDRKMKARFAIIPLSPPVSRFLTVPAEGSYDYILLEDAVRMNLASFFPGETVEECVAFRITRNADLTWREEKAFDFLREMEEVLDARKESACVRLEIADNASPDLRGFLQKHLRVGGEGVYTVSGPLALASFSRMADLQEFDPLRYPAWPPQPSPNLDLKGSLFEALSRRDVLLVHPYESYEPVLRLIEEAADDPDVLAVKQILYRTSRNSPVMAALARAAASGKYVTALVELKARFDEARNIAWARDLEQAGVQVIYGVKGLKTHAKICIIVRREPQGIQRYVHFGTGNYNEITARLYSDVSFMTSNDELGADATSFFNAISGFSQPLKFRKLAAAPLGLREKLLEMIEIEIEQKRQGRRAFLNAKLNSLSDTGLIDALYAASQAGVKIRLNVRGICCLRPGVAGLSENITVVSIVDRFLEHSRILHFHHGGDERVFISSADWMTRNLDRRVELLVPVEDPAGRARLIAMLEACFQDCAKARALQPDGSYLRIKPVGRRRLFRVQESLYLEACHALQQADSSQRTVFEPLRSLESGGP